MADVQGKCLGRAIHIREDRRIVFCDKMDPDDTWSEGDGYFLVKIEDGLICVGWVDGISHEMGIEFRGTDPDTMIREVTRQAFVDKTRAAYVAAEIILAHRCLTDGTEYVQR